MDDCISICNIVKKMIRENKKINEFIEIGEKYNPLKDPNIHDFNVYHEVDKLTPSVISKIFHFTEERVYNIYNAFHFHSECETTFLLIVDDDYDAQVNFKRGFNFYFLLFYFIFYFYIYIYFIFNFI